MKHKQKSLNTNQNSQTKKLSNRNKNHQKHTKIIKHNQNPKIQTKIVKYKLKIVKHKRKSSYTNKFCQK